MRSKLLAVVFAGLMVAGCSDTEPLALDFEEALAAELVSAVDQEQPGGIVRRMVQGVREHGGAEAQRMLRRARTFLDSARIARESGDHEAARNYSTRSYHMLLGAIVLTYPHAPGRIGAMVDAMQRLMRERLGDREAPRIRRVLRHVADLRARADATRRPAVALSLNLTALHVLHRLVEYVRNGTDGAEAAARETFGTTAG